jgi:putative flippase GtrA
MVGIWNTLFGIAIFSFLLKRYESSLGYVGVLSVATPIAIIQSHFSQRIFVWKSIDNYSSELFRFGLVYFCQYAINATLLYLLVDKLKQDVLVSQILITIILVGIFFVVNKRWTFNV